MLRFVTSKLGRGIGEARGEYIAFLDSDDTWVPEKLAVQVEVLERNKKVGIVYSRMQIFDEDGKPCGFKPEEKTGCEVIFTDGTKIIFREAVAAQYLKNLLF